MVNDVKPENIVVIIIVISTLCRSPTAKVRRVASENWRISLDLPHFSLFISPLFSFTHDQIIVYFYDATKKGIHKISDKMLTIYSSVPL